LRRTGEENLLKTGQAGITDQKEIYTTKIRTLKLLKNSIIKNDGCSDVKFL